MCSMGIYYCTPADCIWCACILAVKRKPEIKSKEYRDGVKRRDKIGMRYESLQLLSVQCLQVDDVIPILSPS